VAGKVAKQAGGDALIVVVETPKGSRNKFKCDPERNAFILAHVLPSGSVFPFDFGYIPDTLAEDGDPIDVLLLMDEPAFPGCFVETRLIGVIEAEQTENGETVRNDRLIGVATKSPLHGGLRSLDDLDTQLLNEIEHFFVSYNIAEGKGFKPVGRKGPQHARKLVKDAQKRA
jgi:inorganic pyrophosphatase